MPFNQSHMYHEKNNNIIIYGFHQTTSKVQDKSTGLEGAAMV
jgi:hypothetical protein